MKNNQKGFLALAMSTLLFIAGCGAGNANTANNDAANAAATTAPTAEASSSAAPAADDVNIRFGYSPWLGSAGAIVANEKKIFADKGANVEFVQMEGNTKDAFMSGKLDAVVQSLDAVVQMKANEDAKDPVQVIAVIDRSKGADGIIAANDIAALQDLKGKDIAVSIGSVAHFLLLHALQTVDLKEADVNIVNMNNNLAGSTFMAGQVDAAVTWEPYLSEAAAKDGHLLYSTADAPNLIVDALVVKKSMIDEHPEALKAMVAAFDEGLELFNTTDEGKQIVADALDMDLAAVNSTIATLDLTTADASKTMLVDNKTEWETTMGSFSAFFMDQKIITSPVDTAGIINGFLYE
ncbi:ABC transporter substrate-binding protein [Paenibacillus sp. S150]|uniref:ABC transporter substrate-binding protein n=1 Tax=Paenibacillus sp. S150 TaxID=2749826 RepID=UPI001C59DEB5|nr:ABC transporter substrate-binding protein [Paenibacillus sp. S150]MBW4080677.1 ABC transporter substrate-binding protein [Paenibacillus sp. S150]